MNKSIIQKACILLVILALLAALCFLVPFPRRAERSMLGYKVAADTGEILNSSISLTVDARLYRPLLGSAQNKKLVTSFTVAEQGIQALQAEGKSLQTSQRTPNIFFTPATYRNHLQDLRGAYIYYNDAFDCFLIHIPGADFEIVASVDPSATAEDLVNLFREVR